MGVSSGEPCTGTSDTPYEANVLSQPRSWTTSPRRLGSLQLVWRSPYSWVFRWERDKEELAPRDYERSDDRKAEARWRSSPWHHLLETGGSFLRRQITPDNERMQLEVHISQVDNREGQVTILGDASLWKNDLRIYEVKQIALRLVETR